MLPRGFVMIRSGRPPVIPRSTSCSTATPARSSTRWSTTAPASSSGNFPSRDSCAAAPTHARWSRRARKRLRKRSTARFELSGPGRTFRCHRTETDLPAPFGVSGLHPHAAVIGVGDHGLDGRLAELRQHEFGIAYPKRSVADQHVLVFGGRAALVAHPGAEAVDVGDGEAEVIAAGILARPGALVIRRIDGDIGRLRRHHAADRGVIRSDDVENIGHQARPDRPAAILQLMSISDFNFSGAGLVWISTVCFMTKMPILAMFWRISAASGFSSLTASVMKIDHNLRLNRIAELRRLSAPLQFSTTS